MVEITLDTSIDSAMLVQAKVEDAEGQLNELIGDGLCKEFKKHLDDLSFLDMEPKEDGTINIKASLVLCSRQSVDTNIDMVANYMKEHDFDTDEIETILTMFVGETKGF